METDRLLERAETMQCDDGSGRGLYVIDVLSMGCDNVHAVFAALCLSVSVPLSLFLTVSLSLSLCLSLSVSVCLSHCLSVSVSLSHCLSVSVSLSLSVCLSALSLSL